MNRVENLTTLEFFINGEKVYGLYSDKNIFIKHDQNALHLLRLYLQSSLSHIEPFLKIPAKC